VGLAGEVRPVQRGQERLKEAAKLGFTQAIIPKANKPKHPVPGIEIILVERLKDAVTNILKTTS
jgi:DNA repair protein RadA/Sms